MARRTSTPPSEAVLSPNINEVSAESSIAVLSTETGSPSPPRQPPASSEILSGRRGSLTRLFGGRSSPVGAGTSTLDVNRAAPPMPLGVERDTPRVFDVGPRMSSNYRSLGFSVGADLSGPAGVPLGATFSFETSGGTGALLLARDPIHRYLLRHRGILKAYFLAHREFIYNTYGQVEDVDLDEMALIYGQDCTSDWACAVTLESERGSKVEFEVFTFQHTGVWGEWKTACSASQRGPHRQTNNPGGEQESTERKVDQSIVVKRLTIQTRRFRPMKMTASAGPRSDGAGGQGRGEHEGTENRLGMRDWHDPLNMVHEYNLENSNADYSVASDDDALMLLKMVGRWESVSDLKQKMWREAKRQAKVFVDEDGAASLLFQNPLKSKISWPVVLSSGNKIRRKQTSRHSRTLQAY